MLPFATLVKWTLCKKYNIPNVTGWLHSARKFGKILIVFADEIITVTWQANFLALKMYWVIMLTIYLNLEPKIQN